MKRIRPLFCILLICVMLTGCSFNLATSTSDLISAVSPFGENAEIKKALDDYLGGGYILKNPSFGDYITSYNFYDLDNDGEDEAVAFYQTKDALNTVNMALIKKYDKRWQVDAVTQGLGTGAYRLDFCDINNDSSLDILVCWNSISNSTNHTFAAYEIIFEDGAYSFSQIGESKVINNYTVVDFDSNGKNEILFFEINTGTKTTAKAELYDLSNNRFNLIGETKLDSRVISYTNIKQEKAENDIRIYADALGSSGDSKLTEIIYYSNSYKSIVSPFYSYSSGITSGTSRSCLVNCEDIDSDELIEIPTDDNRDFGDGVVSIDWKIYKNTVLMHKAYSLYVKEDRYTVIIPDEYYDKISADYDSENRELFVYNENGEPIFSVTPKLKALFDEDEPNGYSIIARQSGYYYLAKTYEQSSVEIDENMLEKLIIIC